MNGSHHASKLACSTADGERRLARRRAVPPPEQLREVALARAGELDSSSASASSSCAASQNGLSGARARRRDPRRTRRRRRRGASRGASPQPVDRVGHEVDDELRERRVELVVAERELLRRREPDVDAGMSLLRRRDERLRRIDGRHAVRPRLAARALPSARPVRIRRRRRVAPQRLPRSRPSTARAARVPAHEAVVCVRGDGEHADNLRAVRPARKHAGIAEGRLLAWPETTKPWGLRAYFRVRTLGRHNGKGPIAKVIAFANQKGGVAKTTTTLNLGVALAEKENKVLLIDLDPQGNLTMSQGLNPDEIERSMFDVLVHKIPIQDVIEQREVALAVSSIDLAGAELSLSSMIGRERALEKALAPVRDDYDFVLIDTPPSLGLLTINALVAADGVIVPVQCEYLSLRGLVQLENTLTMIRENLNPVVEIVGILPTMFDKRLLHSKEAVEILRRTSATSC